MANTVSPIKCEHQQLNTAARADCIRNKEQQICGYRLTIVCHCAICGQKFHFPNYPRGTKGLISQTAYAAEKLTELVTPIAPGEFAPELN